MLKVKVTWSCPTLCNPMDYSPWNSPGQNTGLGSLSLLQRIFATQRLNSGEGDGTPLQYSCLENPMDSGAW